jgi:hypothetical protein
MWLLRPSIITPLVIISWVKTVIEEHLKCLRVALHTLTFIFPDSLGPESYLKLSRLCHLVSNFI